MRLKQVRGGAWRTIRFRYFDHRNARRTCLSFDYRFNNDLGFRVVSSPILCEKNQSLALKIPT